MLPAVKSTQSYMVLSTFSERPIQVESTANWPETALGGTIRRLVGYQALLGTAP